MNYLSIYFPAISIKVRHVKIKFNSKWQLNHLWLHPVKGNIYSAYCAACRSIFSGSGSSQVALHEGKEKHDASMKNFKSQSFSFERASDSSVKLSNNGKITLSEDVKVNNTEILQVLKYFPK